MPDKISKQHIKEQIDFNSSKNLLAKEEIKSFQLIEITTSLIEVIQQMNAETEQEMIDFMTDEALQEFCRVNQYFSFNSESVDELKQIYRQFISSIKATNIHANQTVLTELSYANYWKLCDWLVKTNEFAGKMYDTDEEYVQPIVCSEYSPDLQLSVLQIDLKTLKEPILDVGCGREMNLVNYLRDNGFEAFGIDRFVVNNPFYIKSDWLEFEFEPEKWGTIISNLGFSNHFIHHNLRADGNYKAYGEKYMEILSALKPEGSFVYAPDLPFIEKYLNKQIYSCINSKIKDSESKTSRITKIG